MSETTSRLYLVTPPVSVAADVLPAIRAALAAGDVACLLLRLAPGAERDRKAIVKAVAPVVQDAGTALLVEDPRLAAHVGADGAHVAGAGADLAAALDSLKPDRIVGVGHLASRDDAMTAGETGVDYLMFGDEDSATDVVEAVDWWAEIFNVPCVGFAASLAEVGPIAAAGAEFVALGRAVFDDPRGPAAAMKEALAALAESETVGASA